ncbi:MAG: hypothetical protein WB762_10740, partial [Candidatus Sulfotelmatobacter sp.]
LRASLGWYGTYFYDSEMALISEWMEQCGKKVLDNAGIVREAIYRQLLCLIPPAISLCEKSGC